MEFEVLHRSKKKQFIIAGSLVVLILIAIVIGFTFAKYRVTNSLQLASGTVNYSRADLNLVGVYLERVDAPGEFDSATDVPASGYTLNTSESYCTVDGERDSSITIGYADGKLNFSGLTKRGTRCYAYFDVIRDTQVPTISNITSSVTKTSITVNVTASDNEGVTKYFYSINNGAYTESTSSSHTFNSLTAGTTYSIRIYVEDAAGNQSTVQTRSIATESDKVGDTILANYTTVKTRTFPLTTSSKVEDSTTGVIYKSANSNQYDDYGEVYYFAGNPTDNWVRWAGFYWRIIRINGDGSIRMIYQGTSANTTGTNTQLQTSAFNSSYNRSEYVGLKYTSGQQHGQTSNSTIMGVLNTWYNSELASYADDIDTNVGFCSDREMASGYSWSSQPSSTIYYAAYGRLVQSSSNVNPSFKCSNSSDLLKIPVGLITADEVIMAGLPWSGSTTSNYLYTGQYYWTMSPYRFGSSGNAYVFYVYSNGQLSSLWVTSAVGVRPVVNLKASVQISSGSGTSSNPYVIS